MIQNIIGFHKDSGLNWVADLACGHKQHVRHNPPMELREWVLSSVEREKRIGTQLNCKRCDEVGIVVAQGTKKALIETLQEEINSLSEDQLKEIISKFNSLNLAKVSQSAIADATSDLGTLYK